MITSLHSGNFFHDRLRAASARLFWLGFILVLLGLAAIASRSSAPWRQPSLSAGHCSFYSVAIFVSSFWIHGTGPFFGANLFGLLHPPPGRVLAVQSAGRRRGAHLRRGRHVHISGRRGTYVRPGNASGLRLGGHAALGARQHRSGDHHRFRLARHFARRAGFAVRYQFSHAPALAIFLSSRAFKVLQTLFAPLAAGVETVRPD